MTTPLKTHSHSSVGAVVLAGIVALSGAGRAQDTVSSNNSMPVERQNELVKKRCVMCHNAAQRKGGLSFERFDAAHPDPAVAHMMLVKIKEDGAMAAAGNPVPDRETVETFVAALSDERSSASSSNNAWTVDLAVDPLTPNRGHAFVTARANQEVPLAAGGSAVYQLTVSCNGAVRRASTEILTFTKAAPGAPLVSRQAVLPVPAPAWPDTGDALTVNEWFPGERVAFPLATLSPTLRDVFSWCAARPE